MFSVFGVFSVLCFAVVACVGLDFELSVFPCFGGFGVFFFAVWTLNHADLRVSICMLCLKTLLDVYYCLSLWLDAKEIRVLTDKFNGKLT